VVSALTPPPEGLPFGRYLALGYGVAIARELAGPSNWRLRAAIRRIWRAREAVASHRREPEHRRSEVQLAWLRRRVEHAETLVRYLLSQRARVRRVRGVQLTIDWSQPMSTTSTHEDGSGRIDGGRHKHFSESNEHFTPELIALPTMRLLGGIELDPASCEEANALIDADRIFTRETNGLAQEWRCRTAFLNPPGGLVDFNGTPVLPKTKKRLGCRETGACGLPPGHRHEGIESSAVRWWTKLMVEYLSGRTAEAVFLGFSLEIFQTAQGRRADVWGHGQLELLPSPLAFPLCVPSARLDFLHLDEEGAMVEGENPPGGSVVVYLPPRSRDRQDRIAKFVDLFTPIGAVRATGCTGC
jgi:hypothetical protein